MLGNGVTYLREAAQEFLSRCAGREGRFRCGGVPLQPSKAKRERATLLDEVVLTRGIGARGKHDQTMLAPFQRGQA